jgi:hypothetical protein
MTAAIRSHAIHILIGFAAITLIGLLAVPPVPQYASYHQFADQRTILGIPHFWNVISNLPFVLVGALGLRLRAGAAVTVLFAGIFLTGFGSAYYHLDPTTPTLFWDRLPMALGFMAILAHIVGERVNARAGALLLWPLLALGIASLLVWRVTGDLRLYGWVQFFPIFALLLIFWLYPATYTGTANWLIAAALYALAKALEHFDAAIYAALGQTVSGHTLKHLAAAAACYMILRYFQTRQPIAAPQDQIT